MNAKTALLFDKRFPTITTWVLENGYIEIGNNGLLASLVRGFDDGGMVWEGAGEYESVEHLLQDLEEGLAIVMSET